MDKSSLSTKKEMSWKICTIMISKHEHIYYEPLVGHTDGQEHSKNTQTPLKSHQFLRISRWYHIMRQRHSAE